MSDYIAGETESYLVEYRLRCKDNSYKWILGRGMVVKRSEEGVPLRMIGTHVDLTERKAAEEELFLQKEYLKLDVQVFKFFATGSLEKSSSSPVL